MVEPILHIHELSLSYQSGKQSIPVFEKVSMSINKAGIVSLLGPSGCGKSQLVKSILRLHDEKTAIISGDVIWCDDNTCTNLALLSEKEINAIRGNKIGLIQQDPKQVFNPTKKCGIQVQEALQIHRQISNDAAKIMVLNLLEELNFEDNERIFNAYPHQLSGGQLQRVAIAAAIINKPVLIIADEATSALDKENENLIIQILKSYITNYNSALLWISHDLSLSSALSNYIYIMDKGKIVDQCDPLSVSKSEVPITQALLSSTYKRKGSKNLSEKIPLVSLLKLSKAYGSIDVLEDFNLTINMNERVGLIGLSGKGKSTIARLIANIEQPDKGVVSWYKGDTDKRKVQMVFQQPISSFNPKMSIKEAINEAIKFSKETDSPTHKEILDKVGLTLDVLERLPHQLSGGQLQRIALARTLIFKPSLIILDEAITGLDSITQKQILDLLDDIQAIHFVSYLFISHDKNMALEFCDRVIDI
jgi:peptide/nickel transport system ATP-binding protein